MKIKPEVCNHVFYWKTSYLEHFPHFGKNRKNDAEKAPKVIVDAERHRRTPRIPVTGSKMFESKKSVDSGDTGVEK